MKEMPQMREACRCAISLPATYLFLCKKSLQGSCPPPYFLAPFLSCSLGTGMCTRRAEQSTGDVLGEGNLGFEETMLNQKHDQKVEGREMDA